ncbi:hypothetical protein [Terrimonas pollutisoli]|uniref:hypothetical protein n=1 Tax=Terrimonas pollutisoli TaxID=3034147 RepID=UPI0023EDF7AD|nr:hypothetical protein [Terrimonas sp. H1YJ31]
MRNFYLFRRLKKTVLAFLGILILVITLASCSAAGKFKRSYDSRSIPADIKKDGYVLLVLKQDVGGFRGVQNRGVKKLMRRHYGAAFEMVSPTDLKNTKYDDTDKYRYIIGRDFNTGWVVTTNQPMSAGGTFTTHREYHEETIFDRKENKAFPSIGYPSASYSLGMKAFAKFMKKR